MKSWKRILPIFLVIAVICSIGWYLFAYDTAFTKDILVDQARFFELNGNHNIAVWLYDLAYRQSGNNEQVAIEQAQMFKQNGNYSKAEYTLSRAIATNSSVDLYIALCQTYVEQNKLLDAVTMLDRVSGDIKTQLDALRPSAPVATPAPGFYSQYITVTVESDSGTLYVSADGEYPSIEKDKYENGVTLISGENTIYALSVGENGLVSPLSIFGYTVGGVIEEVQLSDTALDTQVRSILGLSSDAQLMTNDLWAITSLVMPSETADYTDLQYFPYLTSLTIKGGNFQNLQALSHLKQLSHLTITESTISAQDLSVISALPNLKELTLSGCMLSNIQNLSGAHDLEYLDLSNNTIRDASALSFMSGLQELNLSHNALTNLSYLSALNNLKVLNVSYNSLASVVPLAGCTALEELDISYNTISSLEGLSTLSGLTKLNAASNQLTDVSGLTANAALTNVTLSRNTISDISALSVLTKLQYFDISYNKVSKLPQWSADCELVFFNGAHNQIKEVTVLGGLKNLNTVNLSNNAIKTVDVLASCPNLIQVDVTGNPVKNVSKLKEQSIIVYYTPV